MTVTATDAKRRTNRSLINGRKMMCPRCKVERDILDFDQREEIEEFSQDTAPIYKCPKARGGCAWEFALADHTVLVAISSSLEVSENGAG